MGQYDLTKGQALKRLKDVQTNIDEATYELVHETLRMVSDDNNRLRGQLNQSITLIRIRELVEQINAKPGAVEIEIKAMREEELLDFLKHWRTTTQQSKEVYAALRRIDANKYPEL